MTPTNSAAAKSRLYFLDDPDKLSPARKRANDLLCSFLTDEQISSFKTFGHCVFIHPNGWAIKIDKYGNVSYWGAEFNPYGFGHEFSYGYSLKARWRRQNVGGIHSCRVPLEDKILAIIFKFLYDFEEFKYTICRNAGHNMLIYNSNHSDTQKQRWRSSRVAIPYYVYDPALDKSKKTAKVDS